MLEINVVDKHKIYEQSSTSVYAWFFFISREDEDKELSNSYVAKRYKHIAAGRKSSNEILLVYDAGSIELHTIGYYNVIRNADEKETIVQNVDNLTAAKEWITSGKALFSLGVAHVFIDSVNYVLTIYVPSRYAVRVGNLEAFVVL